MSRFQMPPFMKLQTYCFIMRMGKQVVQELPVKIVNLNNVLDIEVYSEKYYKVRMIGDTHQDAFYVAKEEFDMKLDNP